MTSRRLISRLSAALLLGALAAPLFAQTGYPTRPIRILVTVPPGGAADFIARAVGGKLSETLGQAVVVENRAGASGTLAADAVAKAAPDGYTLLQNSITTHGIGPHLYPALPYDPVKDFAPITLLATLPLIMAVNAEVPAASVKEFVELAKRKPGAFSFASSGNGGAPHMAGELFREIAGVDLVHVPYKGSGPAVIDLVAGRVQIMFDAAPALLPHIQTGRLRVLAAASTQRNPLLANVPTFAEAGYPGIEVSLWYGMLAPAGTPRPVVDRLNAELVKILDTPDMRERLNARGGEAAPTTPEAFSTFMRDEMARWGAIVRKAGVKAD
jgi:tripartite-type tricarboxylate transporter receptor subunit TctC